MERIAQLVQLSTSAERLVRKSFGVREENPTEAFAVNSHYKV